ncbi:MAG TPA: type IV pilin protein [Gammaproteobacteria bacterium]
MRNRERLAGITLLELMIVVAVVAILGLIAVPGYRHHVQRAQRTEAKTALLLAAANQERFYLQNHCYTADLTLLGFGAAANAPTANGRYVLNVTAATTDAFTIEATAVNEMAADEECRTFTIDSAGARSAAPDPAGRCW